MTYQDAQDLAAEFGAKRCRHAPDAEVAQCWIDRIAALIPAADSAMVGDLDDAIAEANRYA